MNKPICSPTKKRTLLGSVSINPRRTNIFIDSCAFDPKYTPEDIAGDAQLEARKYWIPVEHPELGETITYPGAIAKTSLTSQVKKRAPLIGEHNQEIYQELGFAKDELSNLKEAGVI